MTSQTEELYSRRLRLLRLVVLVVVTTAIALANLSSEPVTTDLLKWYSPNKPVERAYGWPLTWYWRSAAQYLSPVPSTSMAPVLIRWSVARYSMASLTVDVAIWLVSLAASLVGCESLLRRYRPPLHRRPQVLTLLVLMAVSVPMVLANLSFDGSSSKEGYLSETSYGWPLIWYWHVDKFTPFSWDRAWDYRAAALAGNLVLWILMFAAIGLACEWLFRFCRPQLRFNLRTMLVAVALAALFFAWYAAARNRALEQDAVVALIRESGVYYERWGPKWLDIVGADRFRRRIVGARVGQGAMNDEVFERLARLPSLRFLDIAPDLYESQFVFTPGMAAALGDMRQLRMLNVDCRCDDFDKSQPAIHQCFSAIGKLTQLERLRASVWEENRDNLEVLAKLTSLKTLVLDMVPFEDDEGSAEGEKARWAGLADLPIMPRLESVDLPERALDDDDLDHLTRFPRLKSLDLSLSWVKDTGLAKLAPLESLEELAIDEFMATAAGFESLAALKRLKVVHIEHWTDEKVDELPADMFEENDIRLALAALRQSHPGIIIDGRYREFREKCDLVPPWFDREPSRLQMFVRRWLDEP